MSKLYIANLTRQVQEFVYRLPEVNSPRQQRIPIGGQIQIAGELNSAQMDAIIRQHEPYGLIPFNRVGLDKVYLGMCYSIDKPVPWVKIEEGAERNLGVLVERGIEQRKEFAIRAAAQLETELTETRTPATLRQYEQTIVEEEPEGGYGIRGDVKPLGEGIRVERPGGQQSPPPAIRTGRRRRAG